MRHDGMGMVFNNAFERGMGVDGIEYGSEGRTTVLAFWNKIHACVPKLASFGIHIDIPQFGVGSKYLKSCMSLSTDIDTFLENGEVVGVDYFSKAPDEEFLSLFNTERLNIGSTIDILEFLFSEWRQYTLSRYHDVHFTWTRDGSVLMESCITTCDNTCDIKHTYNFMLRITDQDMKFAHCLTVGTFDELLQLIKSNGISLYFRLSKLYPSVEPEANTSNEEGGSSE